MTNPDQLLRIDDVSRLTTIAKSTIWLWVAQGKFPKPITLSATVKVWRQAAINQWINELAGNRPDAPEDPLNAGGAA